MKKISPIDQRREQVEKELEKLRLPKNQKNRRHFKSDENFENWKTRLSEKIQELSDELHILNNPWEFNEVPIAVAANELGVSLSEMINIIYEGLVETSFNGTYKSGVRVTREEIDRAIEIGPEELVRVSEQSVEEIFEDAVQFLHRGDLDSAMKANARIERVSHRVGYQYSIACSFGIELLQGDYSSLSTSLSSLSSYDTIKFAGILDLLKRVVVGIEPKDHLTAVAKEQILDVADGKKLDPLDDTYSSWKCTEFFSKMNENQRHSMLISSVIFAAVEKFNVRTRSRKYFGYLNEPKDSEIEKVVRNSIFTALEVESTYYDSPSSKLFVDKYVELFPKRWTPAELISLLPKNCE